MQTELDEFERELRSLVGDPTNTRPFICEGSPLACKIFLVGFNPATALDAGFWSFWRPGYGFDKQSWFKTYLAERAAKPLKPGKSFRPAISPTRRNIQAFVDGAAPVHVLETNIFAMPSETAPELALRDRQSAPFKWLVERIKPLVIVAHGSDAVTAVQGLGYRGKLVPLTHLSRGWSVANAAAKGGEIAAEM